MEGCRGSTSKLVCGAQAGPPQRRAHVRGAPPGHRWCGRLLAGAVSGRQAAGGRGSQRAAGSRWQAQQARRTRPCGGGSQREEHGGAGRQRLWIEPVANDRFICQIIHLHDQPPDQLRRRRGGGWLVAACGWAGGRGWAGAQRGRAAGRAKGNAARLRARAQLLTGAISRLNMVSSSTVATEPPNARLRPDSQVGAVRGGGGSTCSCFGCSCTTTGCRNSAFTHGGSGMRPPWPPAMLLLLLLLLRLLSRDRCCVGSSAAFVAWQQRLRRVQIGASGATWLLLPSQVFGGRRRPAARRDGSAPAQTRR